ncbi:MAG TPA: tetratricopeptide repeat protein, partial [Terriglobales bacterium]|nr:tetratricopeptide repeat protein [Terriglobales bacterium]
KQFILSASFFRSAEEPTWEAQALENLAAAEAGMGTPKAAIQSYGRALEIWQRQDRQDRQAMILNRIAGLRTAIGDKRTALELYSRALALAQKADNQMLVANTRASLGNLYFEAKNLELARVEFVAALQIYEQQGEKSAQANTLVNLAKLDFAAGEELVRKGAALFRQLGDLQNEQAALALLQLAEPESGSGTREAKGKPA